MLEQIRIGFVDFSGLGIHKPGAFSWIVVGTLAATVAQIEFGIVVVKAPLARFAFSADGDGQPAILRFGAQLTTNQRIGIKVDQLIKITIGKTNINSVIEGGTLHGFGKQLARILTDSVVTNKTGELPQNAGGGGGSAVNSSQVIAGAGCHFLVHR